MASSVAIGVAVRRTLTAAAAKPGSACRSSGLLTRSTLLLSHTRGLNTASHRAATPYMPWVNRRALGHEHHRHHDRAPITARESPHGRHASSGRAPDALDAAELQRKLDALAHGGGASTAGAQPIGDATPATTAAGVILYDGVCGICNRGIMWCVERDPEARIHYVAVQSEAARPLMEHAGLTQRDLLNQFAFASYAADDGVQHASRTGSGGGGVRTNDADDDPFASAASESAASVTVVDGRRVAAVTRASTAALDVASHLPFPFPLLAALGRIAPKAVGDAVYDWVSRNRYAWFGVAEQCVAPSPSLLARFVDRDEMMARIRDGARTWDDLGDDTFVKRKDVAAVVH